MSQPILSQTRQLPVDLQTILRSMSKPNPGRPGQAWPRSIKNAHLLRSCVTNNPPMSVPSHSALEWLVTEQQPA